MDKFVIQKKLLENLNELYKTSLKNFEELKKASIEAPGAMQP